MDETDEKPERGRTTLVLGSGQAVVIIIGYFVVLVFVFIFWDALIGFLASLARQ